MHRATTLITKHQAVLKDCILFKNLEDPARDRLLLLFHEEEWPKKSCLLHNESFFFHLYIIVSGRIKMYQVDNYGEKEITLFILSKHDVFDIYCLLDGCKHDVFYECLDNVKVLAAPMDEIRKWYSQYPSAMTNVLLYSGRQMRLLENFVTDITFSSISTRILKLLIKNANRKSQNLEKINGLSNKEIAYMVGSTRTVVNRHLQKLKRNGSIKVTRNHLEITDLSKLIHLLELQQQKI